ncbi:MAG: haloacid dehalogenase [Candidatus Rokuibacteriota bacterium]|nr:MAG: haloacid dehalogenase [Candidatus Rokubacteria bacterium]
MRLVVFDFDGLILDTEAPVYDAWQAIYAEHGQTLVFEKWAECIGTADVFDPGQELASLCGRALDAEALQARHRVDCDALIAVQSVLPGVREYVREARRLGLRLGVASSSSHAWVDGHLTRLGLREYFDVVRCRDDVSVVKPDPALYLAVLEATGIPARDAFALEDSPNGVWAAKRAGMTCVAVPNPLTARLDLAHADLRLTSLTDLPLGDLLARLRAR